MGSTPVGVQCPLTRSVSRLLGLALVSWAFARVGVQRLSLCLPYLGVISSTLLHLPLDFIRVYSLQPTYLHPFGRPFITHFLGEFPGLGLALVPHVVVPEAEQWCAWSRNPDPNFFDIYQTK